MMSEFDSIRQQLAGIRQQRDTAQREMASAGEQLDRLRRDYAALSRVADPQNGAQQEQLKALQTRIERAEQTFQRRKAGLAEVSISASGIYEQFTPFTDPRQMIGQLRDRYPILLMPLRIETRFKSIGGRTPSAAPRQQLWVRVYPDDCWIDRFEPVLSESEIAAARIFWADIWAAAGDETMERAAWRGLVASIGSGRGAWVVQTYLPENMADLPSRGDPPDTNALFLVVSSDEPFNAAERTAISEYWVRVWRAGDDFAESEAAFTVLVAAVGQTRAEEIAAQYAPANLSAVPVAPLTRDDTPLSVVFIDWPPPDTVDSKARSWTQASRVNLLPERLVVIGYQGQEAVVEVVGNPIPSPLVVGPDPSAPPEEQLQPKDGDLIIPEPMQWMVDFERAVQVGMGFRIDLTPEQARAGFDRLIVLGVRLSADSDASKTQLETLFEHHHYSRQGIRLIPQGTPTNNTEKGGAGYKHGEDADATFETHYKGTRRYTPQTDPMQRQDGQWLADYLGLAPELVQRFAGNDGTDQLEARAMNVALWSGTYGYMLDTMMAPLINQQDIAATRTFFTQFVSGRGPLPAIQIGKQPYGILPTTVYSQMRWFVRGRDIPGTTTHVPQTSAYLTRLYVLLRKIDETWRTLAQQVAHVGKAGDAHKNLLDIVGLHSGAVEYHQRHAESVDHLFNMMNIYGLGGSFFAALIAGAYMQSGKDLLTELGYTGDETPDILERLFLSRQNLLKGPVIDDQPLSETAPIRAYTPDNRNYLQWLIDAANTSLETLRRQQGFTDNKAPKALLYIMLRYSLMQSYWITSLRLFEIASVYTAPQIAALRHQPTFLHVQQQAAPQAAGIQSESRFAQLYVTNAQVTGSESMLIADHITSLLPQRDNTPQAFATAELYEQVAAIEHLKSIPTARLERLFAEHIDLCSYRLDAWEQGFVNLQLSRMRYEQQDQDNDGEPEDSVRRGLYLGAYGWIENLRPENKVLTPKQLSDELSAVFNTDPKAPPLMVDSTNGGHIHAPSLNHAVTAAILRNGYLANATPANPDTLAVNLSSDRVRRALGLIEGIRAGQTLGALLGYQFERGLHDRHNQAEVDEFIYDLRKAFPLVARRLRRTAEPEDTSIEALEARNVLDGVKMAEHIRKTGLKTYPFGKTLPAATAAQQAAINAEVDRMLDSHDAVADVAIAESVHQAAIGNYDRAAGTLDTYSKGNFPPIPDVIQTPRSGITLTQRVGLHLPVGTDPATSPIGGMGITPRSQAEANLNAWLASVLPPPADVACQVTITDPVTAAESVVTVTQHELGLQPLDLLYLLRTAHQFAMTELDDRVIRHAISITAPRADARLQISYTQPVLGKITFFSLLPLVESLRQLTLASRPLLPSDVKLHNEATSGGDETVTLERTRVTTAQANLTALRDDIETYRAALQVLFDDLTTQQPTILTNILILSDDMIALLERASRAALPQTGWGFIYDRRASAYRGILSKAQWLVERWVERLSRFDAAIAAYDALPAPVTPEDEKAYLEKLIQAEQLVTTVATNPLPPLAVYRAALTAPAGPRDRFAAKLSDFEALLTTNADLPTLLANANALLPITDFEFEPFSFLTSEDEFVRLADDLLGMAAALVTDIDKRLVAAQAQLDVHDAAAKPSEQVKALQAAGKALFGEDFRMIPAFTLDPTHAGEWQNAYNDSGTLLTYLKNDLQSDFPVDDWLYGAARVREKLQHWERALFLTEGFGTPATPVLQPIQLPYKAGDRWLALDYPADTVIDGDRLLYTAHYSAPFNPASAQCGLLVDEWTEVIPGSDETTGITFHYDRPNAEPPQAMLLVTPPVFAGEWQWDNLVQALHETLAMARKRAVEPAQVDETAYARFLPATVMAVTINNLTITANLAVNNGVFEHITGGGS